MCVTGCVYTRLGKKTEFYKVFEQKGTELFSVVQTKATDDNNNLVRQTREWERTKEQRWKEVLTPKKFLPFSDRQSFQAFPRKNLAQDFADSMQRAFPRQSFVVRTVIAPKGALVGHGIVHHAAESVNGKPGVRISSGKVKEE